MLQPRFQEIYFLAGKTPAGCVDSKTRVVNTFPTIPDPTQTQLYLKITLLRAIPTYRETTGGIVGLELAAIHKGDDWRDTGA